MSTQRLNRFRNRFVPFLALILAHLLVIPSNASGTMDVSSKHPNEFGVLLIDSNNLPRSTWEAVGGVDSGGYIATADIILPYCSATVIVDCLESVAIYKNGSPATSAVFQGQAAGVTPLSKLDKGLPQAGEANLFSADPQSGITGTQNFSIKVIKRLKFSNLTKKYEHYNLTIFAQPYEVERAKSFKSTSSYDPLKYAWFGDGEAGLIKDFSKDTRVSVTVRMPKDSGGWFSGRLSDPLVQLKSEVNYNSLTVDALPTTVQRIQAWVPMNKKIPALTKMGINNPGDYLALESGYDEPYNPTSLDFTDQLRPFVGDKSTAEETVWVVRSTFIKNPCFPNNRISGFVTTNAMAYSWNPPVLKNGFLDYRVGGMHTTSTGELTKGTYDLVLNSETARCLYKFSSAPISATVSILGASGETQSVETTVLTERDGFLKLSAYGFTFSSPVVRVKLAQKKSATDSKNLKTIVCVKGSAIKKVTAVKPVCPSGFKVK